MKSGWKNLNNDMHDVENMLFEIRLFRNLGKGGIVTYIPYAERFELGICSACIALGISWPTIVSTICALDVPRGAQCVQPAWLDARGRHAFGRCFNA